VVARARTDGLQPRFPETGKASFLVRHPLTLCWAGLIASSLACEPAAESLTRWAIVDSRPLARDCPIRDGDIEPATAMITVLDPLPVYCDIVAVPVATLEGSVDGMPPEPGSRVVMTSDGRYYTTSGYGHQVLEWTGDGHFRRAVGAVGEGPGEFSPRGALMLFLGPGDSLFVLDGAQRWTVFDPDLTFVRAFQGRFNGRNDETLHVVGGRGILTTGDVIGAPPGAEAFHWMGFDGSPGPSFGPERELPLSDRSAREERASGVDSSGLWVTPPNGAPRGLTLERWTLDGRRVRVLERRVPWLPPDGYPEMPGEPRLPEYDRVYVDREGLIWIIVAVRDPRWREVSDEERRGVEQELYDGRLEVINPETGRVVVSYRYDGVADPPPPFSELLNTGRRSYRTVEDSLGLRAIEIFDIHLVEGGTAR